ncbi:MAG: gliding motility-associated C-terminal domain-containing protein, partial [Burkholderiales bacterium]|nr:gliding motility-associated C-terminal domain-containing protein [Flavobacterium sp.]
MTRKNKKSVLCFVFLLTFCSQLAFSQLTSFTLSVTKTDVTCTGNGSLTFQVSGTNPQASVVYSVFLLPNLTTPLAVLTATTLNGLSAGNYHVVATQTLGNLSNVQQQDIVIGGAVIPLVYQLSGSNNSCGNGIITVNVVQGYASTYEIISGPIVRPSQVSNVFSGLTPGVYVIRVYDTCSDAVVQTYTLSNSASQFQIISVKVPECELNFCDTTRIEVAIFGTTINYPLTVEYTVFPPSGTPIVINQTVSSGGSPNETISTAIPFYNAQNYSCNIRITDNCGNIITSDANPIFKELSLEAIQNPQLCNKNIELNVCSFLPPFTVSFISAPSAFNPTLFNNNHPGPFSISPVSYESSGTNQMPVGLYVIQITDACGRSAQSQVTLDESVEPGFQILPTGCGFGQVSMPVPGGSSVASVIMTGAPLGYNHVLPYDVSFNISGGQFVMMNLPVGVYTFTVISTCGQTYFYTINIPPATPEALSSSFIRGCEVGEGSIKLSFQFSALVAISITVAPATFPHPLPYNVSFNLFGGVFYMNSLPEGIYTFIIKDACNFERYFSYNVPGYAVISDAVVLEANCGSFNLLLDYRVSETAPHNYWLQKRDAVTGQWKHPITGSPYVTGTDPTATNSYALSNNSNNLNIASVGSFRVLKTNSIYGNGNPNLQSCFKIVKEFIFTGAPKIITAYNLPCTNNSGNVVIVAEGLAPLSYSITTKDNQPFNVNNGNQITFSGLLPGIYNFQVKDVCGNIVNQLFDLNSLPLPNISQSILCDGQNGQLMVQGFPFLNYQWYKGTNPTQILSTTSTLNFTPFAGSADSGIYYVRMYSAIPNLCTDQLLSYTILNSGSAPEAGNGTTITVCGSTAIIDLFSLLTGTFNTTGIWEEITNSGMLAGHNWLPVGVPFGEYQFRYHVDGLCGSLDEAVVVIHFNNIPLPPTATVNPLICGSESIYLSASTVPSSTYEWIGPNGFSSTEQNPVIVSASALSSGTYTVTAKIGTCPSSPSSVMVNVENPPQFQMTHTCIENENIIIVDPIANSFDPTIASYLWSGPENFTSSENPITITGAKSGVYRVTVTTLNGCSTSATVAVTTTLCNFPAGISPNGDGDNDILDLTGFEVLKFKVFSRYGRVVFEQDNY